MEPFDERIELIHTSYSDSGFGQSDLRTELARLKMINDHCGEQNDLVSFVPTQLEMRGENTITPFTDVRLYLKLHLVLLL